MARFLRGLVEVATVRIRIRSVSSHRIKLLVVYSNSITEDFVVVLLQQQPQQRDSTLVLHSSTPPPTAKCAGSPSPQQKPNANPRPPTARPQTLSACTRAPNA